MGALPGARGVMDGHAKAVVLMYHRIARVDIDPWEMCVSPEHFEEQLEAIRRVATPISLLEFVSACPEGDLPGRAVVVTFDDGYGDNAELAIPRLRQHRIPATFFVCTGNVDTPREFWWDRLETALLNPGVLPPQVTLNLPRGPVSWPLGNAARYSEDQFRADRWTPAWRAAPQTRLAFFHAVWTALWPLPHERRHAMIEELASWAGVDLSPRSSRRTMSSAEIRESARDGLFTIGAHTVDHPPLPSCSAAVQAEQVRQNQKRLQAITGRDVTTFAYPHGLHSAETVDILRAAGFECAVTVENKIARWHADPMRLPRFAVRDLEGREFQDQLEKKFGAS